MGLGQFPSRVVCYTPYQDCTETVSLNGIENKITPVLKELGFGLKMQEDDFNYYDYIIFIYNN